MKFTTEFSKRDILSCGCRNKTVFFDRDGVLNEDVSYLYEIDRLVWIEGAKEALAYLTRRGYDIFVVTNQSGIARGYYTVADMDKLHAYMTAEAAKMGGRIKKFYYCPHLLEGKIAEFAIDCDCRKPKPGLIKQAMSEYPVDKARSFLIGDKPRDVESAEAAGIKGYLFTGGNLLDFVRQIVPQES